MVPLRIAHVVDEFCPAASVFRYRIIAGAGAASAVLCDHRTNESLFPHPHVYTRWASRAVKSWMTLAVGEPRARRLSRRVARWEWRRFLRRGKPDVLHVQFGHVGTTHLPGLLDCELPLLVTFHGSDINTATFRPKGYLRKMRRLFARADLCHFVSHALQKEAELLDCPTHKSRVLYLGTPIPDEAVRNSTRIGMTTFACVASLVPCKGHETLLCAFALLVRDVAEARLHLFGDGHLRSRLEWLASRLALEGRVSFHGQLPYDEVQMRLRRDIDVVVLASQQDDTGAREGLPMSLVEGAALGLPLIGTRCGGIPEIVRDGETGVLVEQREPERLANAMLTLARTPVLRRQLGQTGRKLAREHFDIERQLPQIAALYPDALERRGCSCPEPVEK